MAVPRASLPMRNTTVLPPRSTPVASAKTLGRPFEHEADHAERRAAAARPASPGARRRSTTRRARTACRARSAGRPPCRPASRSDSTRRVVLRPCSRAGGDVVGVGGGDAGEHGRRPPAGGRTPSKKARDRRVRDAGPASRNASWAAVDGGIGQRVVGGRDVQQRAGLLHDDQPVAGRERAGQVLGDPGRDPVPAVHDRAGPPPAAPTGRPRWSAHRHQALRTNGVATTVPARAEPRRSTSTAVPSSTAGRQEGQGDAVPEHGREVAAGGLPHRLAVDDDRRTPPAAAAAPRWRCRAAAGATPRSCSAASASLPRNVGLVHDTTQPNPACSGVMPGPSS